MAQVQNIYGVDRTKQFQLAGNHLKGNRECLVLLVSKEPLSERSIAALQSSFKSLGYGPSACAQLCFSNGNQELSQDEIWDIVEGCDPLAVVCTDAAAGALVAHAYKSPIKLFAPLRISCRPFVCFDNFDAMLNEMDTKQKAWALLKTFPRDLGT